MKIAVILPGRSDYLANTVIDGLIDLQNDQPDLDFATNEKYPSPFDLKKNEKNEKDFVDFAKSADTVVLTWGKNSTNFELAEKINRFDKTIFVDGSELGKNNRFDQNIRDAVENGTYEGTGAIDREMLAKCRLYFRREKPYIKNIIPFPFGIERRCRVNYSPDLQKDIDFTCIFGQDQYPIMRKQAKEFIEKFCKENGLVCRTKKTKGFDFDDNNKKAGRDDFYKILSRTKIGISIGGGGFDTARFWEILGSGATLLTEKIDIYGENDDRLNYKRIIQFNDFDDFKTKIKDMSVVSKSGFKTDNQEYLKIINEHSTKARVLEMIEKFNSI